MKDYTSMSIWRKFEVRPKITEYFVIFWKLHVLTVFTLSGKNAGNSNARTSLHIYIVYCSRVLFLWAIPALHLCSVQFLRKLRGTDDLLFTEVTEWHIFEVKGYFIRPNTGSQTLIFKLTIAQGLKNLEYDSSQALG